LPPSFLSSSPAKNRASEGLAVKGEAQGWCGPQRSEDSALRALTARHRGLRSREKAMNLGKDEQRPMGQGDALKPTPRGERPCVPAARLAG